MFAPAESWDSSIKDPKKCKLGWWGRRGRRRAEVRPRVLPLSLLTRDSLDRTAARTSRQMALGRFSGQTYDTNQGQLWGEVTETWKTRSHCPGGQRESGGSADMPGTDLEKQQEAVLRRPNARPRLNPALGES